MPRITYGGQSYDAGEKSVLDSLTAQGVHIPHSCRSGVCQTCMMQAIHGKPTPRSQEGIKPTLVEQNYFLACSCHPQEDMEVVLPANGIVRLDGKISGIQLLTVDILGIRIKPAQPFTYRAGQYINLFKDENTSRCYSLASVHALDEELFLNVRRVPGGVVSNWIASTLREGDSVTISEAIGDCFYTPGKPEQDILLIGTGSGLAPLYGIVRDALQKGHRGQIVLYHGNYSADGFYLVDELKSLEREHPNFNYLACVSEPTAHLNGYRQGMVLQVALQDHPDLGGWRVFLCGHPEMVKAAKRETYLAGAAIQDIYADPF